MNARRLRSLLVRLASLAAAVAMMLSLPTAASAASSSPFPGQWEATDTDGSNMKLSIAGPARGPFQITWTDDYISLCQGEPGIIRGTGSRNPDDLNILDADVRVECFTSHRELQLHFSFRFHPAADTLSLRYDAGAIVVWTHPGRPLPPPPQFNLRVNYGHDWVESFYEAGHTVWVTVTEADGVTPKATLQALTEPKSYWDGEAGFQSMDAGWLDPDGNPMEGQPDIRANDWVFGWVDNGASAQLQVGTISGTIDIENDSITGTVDASWLTDQVWVQCLDWGSGQEQPYDNVEFGLLSADGSDPFTCSWPDWNIRGGQTVGVGYFSADGNWVSNALMLGYYTVFPEQNALEAWEWPDGATVQATVVGKPECAAQGTAGYTADNPWSTFLWLDFPGCDLAAGDRVTLTDGATTMTHEIQVLDITGVNNAADTVTGTAFAGAAIHAWVHEHSDEADLQLVALDDGTWTADFGSIPFNIDMNMCGRAEITDDQGLRTAVDWCIPRPRLTVFLDQHVVETYDWPSGTTVTAAISGQEQCTVSGTAEWNGGDFWITSTRMDFPAECEPAAGDILSITDGATTITHRIRNLAIASVDDAANTVAGTGEPGEALHTWVHEAYDQTYREGTIAQDGTWLFTFDALEAGMCGRVEITDEATNSTAVDWCIPNPYFTVYPEQNALEAWDWPDGATVQATVTNRPECAAEGTGGYREDNPWSTFLWLDIPCDLAPGDEVVLSDGITVRTHSIRDLTITQVDDSGNTVSGTAYAGAVVDAWVHNYYDETSVQLLAAEGAWTADFGALGFDIQAGMCGRAQITDDQGNSTAVDWCITAPQPGNFYAVPDEERIYTADWTPPGELVVTINGVEVARQEVTSTSEMLFDLNGIYDIQAGDLITLMQGDLTRQLLVDPVHVTGFDLGSHTIFGVSDPGELLVAVNGADVWTTVGEDGNWQVSSPDFEPMEWGSAIKTDEDGDQTRDIFMIPRPMMYVFPEEDVAVGTVWFEGQYVTLTIYHTDPGKTETEVFHETQPVLPPSVVPWTVVVFNVGDSHDLQPGDRLVMEQNGYQRELVLSGIQITSVDPAAHTASGTGTPGATLHIWVRYDEGFYSLDSSVDAGGGWSIEHEFLVPGASLEVAEVDADGDETRVRMQIPAP